MIEKYLSDGAGCRCHNWCRADYPSGFSSFHHASCDQFKSHMEMHVLSKKYMTGVVEVGNLREHLKKAKDLIDALGFEDGFFERLYIGFRPLSQKEDDDVHEKFNKLRELAEEWIEAAAKVTK